jgi:hypothetical protein
MVTDLTIVENPGLHRGFSFSGLFKPSGCRTIFSSVASPHIAYRGRQGSPFWGLDLNHRSVPQAGSAIHGGK